MNRHTSPAFQSVLLLLESGPASWFVSHNPDPTSVVNVGNYTGCTPNNTYKLWLQENQTTTNNKSINCATLNTAGWTTLHWVMCDLRFQLICTTNLTGQDQSLGQWSAWIKDCGYVPFNKSTFNPSGGGWDWPMFVQKLGLYWLCGNGAWKFYWDVGQIHVPQVESFQQYVVLQLCQDLQCATIFPSRQKRDEGAPLPTDGIGLVISCFLVRDLSQNWDSALALPPNAHPSRCPAPKQRATSQGSQTKVARTGICGRSSPSLGSHFHSPTNTQALLLLSVVG